MSVEVESDAQDGSESRVDELHGSRIEDSALTDFMAAPPSLISRGLLYLIGLFTLIIIIWSVLNKIDVIVSVPAYVLPEGRLEFVQQPMAGIVKKILVEQGDTVKRGDALLQFRADEFNLLLSNFRSREKELRLAQENHDIVAVREIKLINYKLETELENQLRREIIHQTTQKKRDEKINRLGLEIKNAISIDALLKQELDVSRKLANKGIVPAQRILELSRLKEESNIRIDSLNSSLREDRFSKSIDAEQFNLQVEQHKAEIKVLENQMVSVQQLAEERLSQAQIAYDKSNDLLNLKTEGVFLNGNIHNIGDSGEIDNELVLRAAVDGIVAEVLINNPGESIERGRTVISIFPADVSMLMQLLVADKDIGKIRHQQPVKFKFSAFPFAEYGVLKGFVKSIGTVKTAGDAGTGKTYQAIASLNQEYFRVDEEPFYLLPGMSATAEISTGQKRVIDLLLSPFKKLASAKPASL